MGWFIDQMAEAGMRELIRLGVIKRKRVVRENDTVECIEWRLRESHREEKTFGELHLHPNCSGRTVRMKDRLPFFCSSCGAGQNGEWLMQPHNVFLGNGCPCCQSIAGTKARFDAAPYLECYQLHAVSSSSGKVNVNSVRYIVTSPDGFGSNPVMKSSINRAVRQGRIPGATEITHQREVKEIAEKFTAVFNKGAEICFVAWGMDHTATPGPFFSISTGIRTMREPVIDAAMPMSGVKGLIERELMDAKTHKIWSDEAEKYKATIIGYIHTRGQGIKIKYRSRTGYEKVHTYTRAKETNWGQSGYKKGEKLCQAVLLELLPNADWRWNKRYQFLRYKSSLLELDGYSQILNLAVEVQGVQHYDPKNAFDNTPEDFAERVKRDKFKVEQCGIEKIKFLIVPPLPLDPGLYLYFIQDMLLSLGIAFTPGVTVEQVSTRWQNICRNPLQKLQSSVTYGLGVHTLISPQLEGVTSATVITYSCGNCGEPNKAEAQGFTSGMPRRYCPKCRGKELGTRRHTELLEGCNVELPAAVFSRLVARTGEGVFLICDRGHEQRVSSIDDVKSLHDKNNYHCPHCRLLELGYKVSNQATRLSAAVLERYKPEFEAKIQEAGLVLTGEIFMRYDGEFGVICAQVNCPDEHHFEIGLTELSQLCSNKFLSDRLVVPHVCEACCYPGIKIDSRKGTVFHRLAFLRDYHPRVDYVSGFDFTGKAMEEYWCGERYKISGMPHPNFLIRYRTIQAKDKAEKFRTPCSVCAVERGAQLPSSSKTLEMIMGRMLLISEALADHTGSLPYIPTVALSPGEQHVERKYISTSKTRLSFFCGVTGHKLETKTADNFFNVHKGGYCKACLQIAGVENVDVLFNSE